MDWWECWQVCVVVVYGNVMFYIGWRMSRNHLTRADLLRMLWEREGE